MSYEAFNKTCIRAEVAWDDREFRRFVEFIYPEAVAGAADEALWEAAGIGLQLSKAVVWKDTRSLEKSGRRQRTKKSQRPVGLFREFEVAIRFGGYIVNPKTGRPVDYAVYVEENQKAREGKGFLERGTEKAVEMLPDMYDRAIRKRLEGLY